MHLQDAFIVLEKTPSTDMDREIVIWSLPKFKLSLFQNGNALFGISFMVIQRPYLMKIVKFFEKHHTRMICYEL